MIGLIAIACSFLSLGMVIDALITTRILVQFIGQIFAVILLRRLKPDMPRPFRIWLYPVPALVALVGWIFVFITSDWRVILLGLGIAGAWRAVLPRLVVAQRAMAVRVTWHEALASLVILTGALRCPWCSRCTRCRCTRCIVLGAWCTPH